MADTSDLKYLSPKELLAKYKIPIWFRNYKYAIEWENYTEKTAAEPVTHGGLIKRSYYRKGDVCYCTWTMTVPRYRRTVRSGTAVLYLVIDRTAVARLLLDINRSALMKLNKQAASGIAPNPNEIKSAAIEILALIRETPVLKQLSEAIKLNDYAKMLDAMEKISDDLDAELLQLEALRKIDRFRISEAKFVDAFHSLVLIDELKQERTGKVPCDDGIRKQEDGVIVEREDERELVDAEPGESPESVMKRMLEKAKALKQ